MTERLHDVVLLIADISGYTSFLRANAETIVHSQTVITRLLESILDEWTPPIEVSKLEGDAVLAYCLKPVPESVPGEGRRALGERVAAVRERFRRTVAELSRSRYCDCDACRGIEDLRVKVIVHSGRAVLHQVRRFHEIAGMDVIVVHRLLKNSVGADDYVLLTVDPRHHNLWVGAAEYGLTPAAARADVQPPAGWSETPVIESCEGVGKVSGSAWLPPESAPRRWLDEHRELPLARKLAHKTRWTLGILRDEVLVRLGIRRRPGYRNIPPIGPIELAERFAGLVMLLVMPLLLPITLVQNLLAVVAEHRAGRGSTSSDGG